MSGYFSEIYATQEQSGPLIYANGSWTPDSSWTPDGLSEGALLPKEIAEYDDAYPFYLPERPRLAHTVEVDTVEAFEELLHQSSLVHGGGGRYHDPYVWSNAAHEKEHAAAAFGAKVRYAVAFWANEDGSVRCFQGFMSAYDWKTTKLQLGIAAAYPASVSNTDLARMRVLGYSGVEDVARRARGAGLIVPLSAAVQAPEYLNLPITADQRNHAAV